MALGIAALGHRFRDRVRAIYRSLPGRTPSRGRRRRSAGNVSSLQNGCQTGWGGSCATSLWKASHNCAT